MVTGGASGIGEATCRVLARAGASVIIVDLDHTRADALSRELPGSSALVLDITDEASVRRAFSSIPRLDVLVNNAGIGLVGGIEETELPDFQRLFQVNVEGTYLMTRAAMPLLIAAKGSIVNIGSVAGLVGIKKRYAYCATKGAIVAMTRQLAVDYATQVRVNCICPGHGRYAIRRGLPGKISQARKGKGARRIEPAAAGGPIGQAGGDRAPGALPGIG